MKYLTCLMTFLPLCLVTTAATPNEWDPTKVHAAKITCPKCRGVKTRNQCSSCGREGWQFAVVCGDKILSSSDVDACFPSIATTEIAKDPAKYSDRSITFAGKIFHAETTEDGDTFLQMETSSPTNTGRTVDQNVIVIHDGELPGVAKGDHVQVYGFCRGNTTYTSTAGLRLTCPKIEAQFVVSEGMWYYPKTTASLRMMRLRIVQGASRP